MGFEDLCLCLGSKAKFFKHIKSCLIGVWEVVSIRTYHIKQNILFKDDKF
jgi:hypothetical protein